MSEKNATASIETASTETAADEAQSFDEYRAIKEALQPYIEAAKTGDGTLMKTAFFDHAHIVGSTNGVFNNFDVEAFGRRVDDNDPSPDIQHHIAWIDISGPAAAARVEFIGWRGFRFTDFFVLYKHDGQWKISGKVYNSHTRN